MIGFGLVGFVEGIFGVDLNSLLLLWWLGCCGFKRVVEKVVAPAMVVVMLAID